MSDLLSLSEAKTALGLASTDTSQDAQLTQLIPMVSAAIRSYTERDFGAPAVTETRTFEYDGSGFLDIDDATAVTSVALVAPGLPAQPLDAALMEWRAMPQRRDDAPVYFYILVAGGYAISPEMGFKQNLDRIWAERSYLTVPSLAEVTATWGWPIIPQDVKLAAIWSLESWSGTAGISGVTSESIESYSRSFAGSDSAQTLLGLPNRARDLLSNYQKLYA